MSSQKPQTRVVIRGHAFKTPSARPLSTVLYCAQCDQRYTVSRETLLLEGFACSCGALRMEPRFEQTTQPLPVEVIQSQVLERGSSRQSHKRGDGTTGRRYVLGGDR